MLRMIMKKTSLLNAIIDIGQQAIHQTVITGSGLRIYIDWLIDWNIGQSKTHIIKNSWPYSKARTKQLLGLRLRFGNFEDP